MVNNGYQPRAPKQTTVPPGGESEIKTPLYFMEREQFGVKSERPPTVEYRPNARVQKDGIDYSNVFLAVSFFVVGFAVGCSFA